MPLASDRRPRRDVGLSIAVAIFLGFPAGVFGTAIVATIVIGLGFIGDDTYTDFDGMLFGAIGGLWTGIWTGGPVFALVTIRRPLDHAWPRIFGACLVSSLIGLAVEWVLIAMDPSYNELWLLFWFPVFTLVLGSLWYMHLTRHLAPIKPAPSAA